MRDLARHIAVSLLALSLLFTSVTMAAARGQAMAEGQMVLCLGGGVVTVYVDSEGKPTGAPHVCPDCALSLLAWVEGADTDTAPMRVWRRVAPSFARIAAEKTLRLRATARGPPDTV
ncbi:hypothetical protein KUH32_01835 [Thalassococcus sp. CAU 1522]|uniref:DUF2946 domain-containing protein n=1 Tax=Thalassococcus arenae TaxID=2851652 RepID=A0ABS6N3A6_9RHOB|nr:hypothetical protein [Thalassococcus arenae]MBV2358503.1 hypothetical protein [Thalassococcus arenae]